ncbi:MAG: hypothetical protein BGO77_06715 [Caedibacter sp. 37-49]|nr:MAG: hypothetical protein BGO77_06715 [Caedibacter sp. 37-49]
MKKELLLSYIGFTIFFSHFESAEGRFAAATSPALKKTAVDSLSTTISPEMRKQSEEAIANCEKVYQHVKEQGKQFDNIKKPSLFSSEKLKKAYQGKKVFNLRFAEFTKFTNEKIKIRTVRTPSDLRDAVAAYSSNCTRFSDGLTKFVDWVIKGKPIDKISETIFKDWMKEAK